MKNVLLGKDLENEFKRKFSIETEFSELPGDKLIGDILYSFLEEIIPEFVKRSKTFLDPDCYSKLGISMIERSDCQLSIDFYVQDSELIYKSLRKNKSAMINFFNRNLELKFDTYEVKKINGYLIKVTFTNSIKHKELLNKIENQPKDKVLIGNSKMELNIDNVKPVLITGITASGKTTLAKMIADNITKVSDNEIVYIDELFHINSIYKGIKTYPAHLINSNKSLTIKDFRLINEVSKRYHDLCCNKIDKNTLYLFIDCFLKMNDKLLSLFEEMNIKLFQITPPCEEMLNLNFNEILYVSQSKDKPHSSIYKYSLNEIPLPEAFSNNNYVLKFKNKKVEEMTTF